MNTTTTLASTPVTGPLATPVTTTDLDTLLVNMAYLTEDGREVTVVFQGSEDDYDAELRPFIHTLYGVRVVYTVGEVYDWYTGPLTPHGWVSAPVAVQFKDETDIDGETAGPMRLLFDGETERTGMRRYSPERKAARWVLRSEAAQVAGVLGLTLSEF